MPQRAPKFLLRHPAGDGVAWSEIPVEGLRIGRSESCEIVLPHDEVSREHAEIRCEGGSWVLRDLGSANGTWIDAERVSERTLRDGDRIAIDDFELLCWIDTPRADGAVLDTRTQAGPRLDVGDFDALVAQVLPEPSRAKLGEARTLLRLFHRATDALLESDELDASLARLLDLVFEHLPAERCTALLLDADSGRLAPRVERYLPGAATTGLPVSRHIAEEALRTRQAVLVGDAAADERFTLSESIRVQHIASAMCAPLCHRERVVGLLYVDRTSGGEAFGPTELAVLSILATIGAAALERAQMRASLARERRIRERLGRYHAPNVVERIAREAEREGGAMQTEEREVSVLFADLAGFTRFAEQLAPREVTVYLNEVLELLTQAVFLHGGTLDKFLGDAVMAFFGAPLAQPDHALRAVRAALDMQSRLAARNARQPPERRLGLHVGINTGPVIVGDIGAEQRLDYTVIGDAVNVASRLQSQVATAGQVVIGEATWAAVAGSFAGEALPPLLLKGRSAPFRPFLVRGPRE